MARVTLLGLIVTLLCFSYKSAAKTATTYIVTTQDERESTRFTLTEWLRIKERMKMMDLWLAMFSEPAKDRFRPELSIFYGHKTGLTAFSGNPTPSQLGLPKLNAWRNSVDYGHGQLWLTNLISGTFGVRTLNIDLGVDAYLHKSILPLSGITTSSGSPLVLKDYLRTNSISLRLFGKNIQDSSIVLKYGEFASNKEAAKYLLPGSKANYHGTVASGELQLYVTRWLGFEGNFRQLKSTKTSLGLQGASEAYDYGVYLEISLLRFMAGLYSETWQFSSPDQADLTETSVGRYLGMKINF